MKKLFLYAIIALTGFILDQPVKRVFAHETTIPQKLQAVVFDIPPFATLDEHGVIYGRMVDAFKTIADQQQLKYDLRLLPWIRAQEMGRTGQADILPLCARDEDRSQYFFFTKPFDYADMVFVTKTKEDFEQFTTFETLKGFGPLVGTTSGYITESYMKQAGLQGYQRIFKNENSLEMLNIGRMRVYIGLRDVIEKLQEGVPEEKYFVRHILRINATMCVSRQNPMGLELVKSLNHGIDHFLMHEKEISAALKK